MKSFNYTTIEGDRWDTLAAKFYGGNYGIRILVDANSDVPLTAVFPLGTKLVVPIIDDAPVKKEANLPPWKKK